MKMLCEKLIKFKGKNHYENKTPKYNAFFNQ